MSTKEKILARLKAAKNVLSGETLAQELGVSRTAIWKAIKELENSHLVFHEETEIKNYGFTH